LLSDSGGFRQNQNPVQSQNPVQNQNPVQGQNPVEADQNPAGEEQKY
jgi:hypothetical protein